MSFQIGDLVSPCHYVELCDTIQLENLTDIFVLGDLGLLLEVVAEDRYFDGHEALMCLILNQRGKVGWVCGKHINKI